MSTRKTSRAKHTRPVPFVRRSTWNDHLPELRRLVAESVDLEAIFDFFLSHLAEDESFVRSSKPSKNERLSAFLRAIVKLTVTDGPPASIQWLEVPGHRLWHGGFLVAPETAVQAVYFEDLNRGLCTVCRLSGGPVHFLRFSMPEQDVDLTTMKLISSNLRSCGGVN